MPQRQDVPSERHPFTAPLPLARRQEPGPMAGAGPAAEPRLPPVPPCPLPGPGPGSARWPLAHTETSVGRGGATTPPILATRCLVRVPVPGPHPILGDIRDEWRKMRVLRHPLTTPAPAPPWLGTVTPESPVHLHPGRGPQRTDTRTCRSGEFRTLTTGENYQNIPLSVLGWSGKIPDKSQFSQTL